MLRGRKLRAKIQAFYVWHMRERDDVLEKVTLTDKLSNLAKRPFRAVKALYKRHKEEI